MSAANPNVVPLGFAAEFASGQLGVASATKPCRSVMIKGLKAMVIESFTEERNTCLSEAWNPPPVR